MKGMFRYILAVCLIISTMNVAFATPADVTDMNEQRAVDVLMELGIVHGFSDGTYKPELMVKRAEMAKLIVVSLGLSDMATGNTTIFTDVPSDSWAVGYIRACAELGIIQGYGDGTFGPENPVKYSEAATILLRALGWTDETIGGTWPSNYVNKAKELGIFKGVKYRKANATRGDIAEMFYNTLGLQIDAVDQGISASTRIIPDNMLIRCRAMAPDNLEVYTGAGDELVNCVEYIGQYSSIYKTSDGSKILVPVNAVKTLVGKKVNDNTFRVGRKYYIFATSGNSLFYTYNNTSRNKYFTNVAGLVNGKEYYLSVNVNGDVIKNVYAANIWTANAAGIINDEDIAGILNQNKLFGVKFYTNGGKIDGKEYQLVGANKLADIKKGNVVIVYKQSSILGFRIRKVAVGTELIKDAVITERNGGEVVINGKTYEASTAPGAITDLATNPIYDPANNNKFKIYLDAYGKIYSADKYVDMNS